MTTRKLLLCIAPLALCLLDQTITLASQSSSYWSGVYADANEGNPLFNWLLRQHPLAFEAGIAAWIGLFCGLILVLPRLAAMVVSVAVVLGHTWGTATWLYWRLQNGYWLTLGLFLASAILIVWTWEAIERQYRLAAPRMQRSDLTANVSGVGPDCGTLPPDRASAKPDEGAH